MDSLTPADHARALIGALEFADDPEMGDTPRRLVEWLSQFAQPAQEGPALSLCATHSQVPVVMRDIPFHSVCAHHLLPFFGTATVAYQPDGTLAGLGALSRTVAHFAARPQVQERLGEQIARHLAEGLRPRGLVVRLTARQLCVEITQGVRPTIVTEAVVGTPGADLYRLMEA